MIVVKVIFDFKVTILGIKNMLLSSGWFISIYFTYHIGNLIVEYNNNN